MKNVWKDLVKSILTGTGIAMAIFCIVGVVFDLSYGGGFRLENYQFTKMVAGCVLIGTGFGAPSIVYGYDKIPRPICMIIHLGIGITVYTITAYAVGWIGAGENIMTGFIIPFMTQLAVVFLIWLLFMRHYKNEAKQINEKIQNLK